MSKQAQQVDQLALNMQARQIVLANAVEMMQEIYSNSQIPANNSIFTVPFRNVGLIRGFFVKVQGTINNTGANTLALTQFGIANVLSKITLTDYNNTVRIQTTGWHLNLMNSAKQPMVFCGAYSPNVSINYGNNFDVMSAPSTIATTVDGAIQVYYYIPCAYAKNDLRGAIYANVVNANAQLQLEVNTTPVIAGNADYTLAVYSNPANANIGWKAGTNVTVTVWQDYLDQLPMAQGGPILPQLDLNTIYELKNTAFTSLSVGQDFPIGYPNFRTFLSTAVVFDNGGTLGIGADVNYWALYAANTTQFFKYGAEETAMLARTVFLADPPRGTYFFSHRTKPIQTVQYGNMNLVLNPSTVNANAQLLVGWEAFATVSQVQYASSLPAA